MTEQYIPSRFRERNVNRFRNILREVVAGTPEIRFKNSEIGLNPTTAIARVSDAMRAVINGIVFYEDVDADKLREKRPLYRIYYDQLTSEVIVTQRRLPLTEGGVATTFVDIVDVTLRMEETTFPEDIHAFAVLFGHYRLRGRVTILGMLSEAIKQDLASTHGVMFTQTAPNETIMS